MVRLVCRCNGVQPTLRVAYQALITGAYARLGGLALWAERDDETAEISPGTASGEQQRPRRRGQLHLREHSTRLIVEPQENAAAAVRYEPDAALVHAHEKPGAALGPE